MRVPVVLSLSLSLVVAGHAVARAENCVDDADEARASGRRPCMGVGSSLGRFEVMRAPGFLDVRVGTMRLGLYGNDPAGRGTAFELATWEAIGDGDELEGPRDLGDRAALHVLTIRRQRDTATWGAYVAGELVTRWFGHTRAITPRFGLRLGRYDRSAIVIEAALAGAYLIGGDGDHRSLLADADIGARATMVVARHLQLEARGRYRDLGAADGRHVRDLMAAIGVELDVTPPGPGRRDPKARPDTFRAMTLFVGLAARRALIDLDPDAAAPAFPTGRSAPREPAPWQLMAWIDLDFAINSARTIW